MYRDTLAILVTILVIYWKSTMSSASFLSASTTKLRDFLSLDLAAGLEKYIQHENKRLEIIKSAKGYEDEVPLVLVRLEKLGRLSHILASSQAERVKLQQQSLSVPHPTTTLRLVRDFLDTWSDKLRNETLYGFRLREFLTNDKSELPSDSDLDEVARALAEIQYVYNMTTSDLYAGKVMGLQGSPLKPRDAYDVGRVSMKMGHLKQAATWFERAMSEIPATERASGNSSFPVAETLASLGIILFNVGFAADVLLGDVVVGF
ncbi:hypothetical protein BaRGS_00028690 [Batillaria attramentaria]|uniref:Prolyl 4-hydroxylase N-terminal domain-containing protein n=1 Tax=Batillaria attramentaria TaxID=370345 RepID=A0ABD0JYR7_9CAEN